MVSSERVRLARELHDGFSQDLVALGYSIDSLLAQSDNSLALKSEIRALRFRVSEILERVRREMFDLRRTQDLEISGDLVEVPSSITNEIIRIASEILRNIQEHSKATQITLSASIANGAVSVDISDNGNGGARTKEERFGLAGIGERIKALQGELLIESDGHGTRVAFNIPKQEND